MQILVNQSSTIRRMLAQLAQWCGRQTRRPLLIAVLAASLATTLARADELKLTTGDVLYGTIVEQTDTAVTIEHEVLGRLSVPTDTVASIIVAAPQAEGADKTAAQEETAAEADPPAEEEAPKKEKEWKLHFNLGANSTTGNTEEQALRLGLDAQRERSDSRTKIDTSYYWKSSNHTTTDHKATAGAKHDWLMPDSPWFWFVDGRYDYDLFESWDQRIASHGGPGYQLIDTQKFKWEVRGGLGTRKEFGSNNDDWMLEGVLGTDFAWQISERQKLEAAIEFLPVFDDLEDYRTRSKIGWKMKISETENMDLSLTAGLAHEYQSIVDPAHDRNDLRIFAGIGVDF